LLSILDLSEGDFVLDFFGGSGTTAQACLEYNKDLKFIIVQWPELIDNSKKTIKYSNIAKASSERIRKVMVSHNVFGFKYFVLKPSSYKTWKNVEGSSVKNLQAALEFYAESPLEEDWTVPKLLTETLLL